MDKTEVFSSGFPLQKLPELTEEVFFAYHLQINKLLYLNLAFEKVWLLSREAVISNPVLLFESVHPDDRTHVRNAFLTVKNEKQKQFPEFRIIVPGEKFKWIKVGAYLSNNNGSEIIVGTAADITGPKDYNDTLHKFTNKKNTILQILTHDLLGPLGNIEMSTLMLKDFAEVNNNEGILELIGLINKSCKKSLNMILDLVKTEFLESSEAALVKQRADVILKIREMIEQFQLSPTAPKQRFSFETTEESLFAIIDESKFMQVLNNLISNSLKFTPDDGNITIGVKDEGDNVLITVKDTGIGIPQKLQPFLFDKHTKAARTGIKGEPSNGIGMSIIKTIVEWHNGYIWFESTEGKGTTFFVEIPKNG